MAKKKNFVDVTIPDMSEAEAIKIAEKDDATFIERVCAYNRLQKLAESLNARIGSLKTAITSTGITELDTMGVEGVSCLYGGSLLAVSKKVKEEVVIDPAIKNSPTAKNFLKTSVTLQRAKAVKAFKDGTIDPSDAKFFSSFVSTSVNIKRSSVNIQNAGDDDNN